MCCHEGAKTLISKRAPRQTETQKSGNKQGEGFKKERKNPEISHISSRNRNQAGKRQEKAKCVFSSTMSVKKKNATQAKMQCLSKHESHDYKFIRNHRRLGRGTVLLGVVANSLINSLHSLEFL